MAIYFKSEINKRSVNEDCYCDLKLRLNHEAAVHVMAVADGMGGLSGGKYYSRAAVNLFCEMLLKVIMDEEFRGGSLPDQTELLKSFCKDAFREINQELYTRGLNAGLKGGTTLSVVLHFWHSYLIVNCGDSPVYYIKNDRLHLASEIQNAASQMVREGKISEGSLVFYQNRSRLLQYLGRRTPVEPFFRVIEDRDADYILLGTDGAFGDLSQDKLCELFAKNQRKQDFLQDLFAASREAGEEDNQTAILCITEIPGFFRSQKPESNAGEDNISVMRDWDNHIEKTDEAIPGSYKIMKLRKASLRERIFAHWSSGGKD